ncbi:hypothetical protein PYCC9005_003369 [Savitreella phatthalungensis]
MEQQQTFSTMLPSVDVHRLTHRPGLVTRHSAQLLSRRSERERQLIAHGHGRAQVVTEPVFVPTLDQIRQSRQNELESSRLAAAYGLGHRRPGTSTDEPVTRFALVVAVANRAHQQRLRQQASHAAPRPPMPMELSEDRRLVREAAQRHIRRLAPKHHYSSLDQLRLTQAHRQRMRALAIATPHRPVVFSKHVGHASVVHEHHGFCYDLPVIVEIRCYPVRDDDDEREVPGVKRSKNTSSARDRKLALANARATIFMQASAATGVPVGLTSDRRMLKTRMADFYATAATGDLLLEGGWLSSTSQYIQQRSRSLVSHAGIIYRHPLDNTLWLLTSRTWRSVRWQFPQALRDLADFDTLTRIQGVQMHRLEPYLARQRVYGQYFLHRRLARSGSSAASVLDPTGVSPEERDRLGVALMAWYDFHRGFPAPEKSETLERMRAYCRVVAGKVPKSGPSTVALSASQVCFQALTHAGIFRALHHHQLNDPATAFPEALMPRQLIGLAPGWRFELPCLLDGPEKSLVARHQQLSQSASIEGRFVGV